MLIFTVVLLILEIEFLLMSKLFTPTTKKVIYEELLLP